MTEYNARARKAEENPGSIHKNKLCEGYGQLSQREEAKLPHGNKRRQKLCIGQVQQKNHQKKSAHSQRKCFPHIPTDKSQEKGKASHGTYGHKDNACLSRRPDSGWKTASPEEKMSPERRSK